MPHRQGALDGSIATNIEEVEASLIHSTRDGVQQILQQALEEEIEAHLKASREKLDGDGHRQVVRNGHAPQRTILTGVGRLTITGRKSFLNRWVVLF